MSYPRPVWICSIASLLLLAQIAVSPAAEPRKLAFLVGVSKYDKAGLSTLAYAEDDAKDLSKKLTEVGFKVETLLGNASDSQRATRENLRKQLEEKFCTEIKRLNKSDLVLIALSGHGEQLDVTKNCKTVEDHFFCPVDALKTDPATLLSVGDLIELVGRNSGAENNLFIIDACRNNPAKGAKGVDGSRISLPRNMAALFGSSAGQQSFESDRLKHGLLTYYLLEGLTGDGAKEKDGEITWDSLVSYTRKQVSRNSGKLVGSEQTPNSISNINGNPPVLVHAAKATASVPGPARTGESVPKSAPSGEKFTNSVGQKFAYIPAGEFTMGNSEPIDKIMKDFAGTQQGWLEDSAKTHKVKITKPFYLGIYHVTKGDFALFVKEQGYKTEPESDAIGGQALPEPGKWDCKPGFSWRNTGFPQEDNYPVVNITWNDAQAYIGWLSKKDGRNYRLPTEAEWEYACRAGTTTHYYNGNDPERVVEIANVMDASIKKVYTNWPTIKADDGYAYTSPVGHFKANKFGLYDMQGNALQWCSDWYDKDYYARSPENDPQGAESGADRVLRGGSWHYMAVLCRSSHRNHYPAGYRFVYAGFRLVLDK